MIFRVFLLAIVIGFFIVMSGVLLDAVEPYAFPLHMFQGKARYASNNVIVGPYPERNVIKELKENVGVVEIISLMNDSIYERNMLKREERTAKEFDLAFRNFPMQVKWINDEQPILVSKDQKKLNEISSPQFTKWLANPMPIHRHKANLDMAERVAAYVESKYGKNNTRGKVYINCYLGKHRASLVYEAVKKAESRHAVQISKTK